MQETEIEVAGTKLRYCHAGAGATVLFLHDAAGASWDPLLDMLSAKHRVIAPEHPGFGRRQIPEWMTRPRWLDRGRDRDPRYLPPRVS
jgi:pimeloyl-ACP methyl ester carboxylesterase